MLGRMVVLFQLFKESPYCLPQWLYQFTFPPAMQECSLFSIPSPAFIICRLFDDGHSDSHTFYSCYKPLLLHWTFAVLWKFPYFFSSDFFFSSFIFFMILIFKNLLYFFYIYSFVCLSYCPFPLASNP